MSDSIIMQCEQLSKIFNQGATKINVLDTLDFRVEKGDCVAIIGTSGSGKTTLLQIMGGLDLPTSGKISIKNKDLAKLNEKQRGKIRNQALGFIFQFHHLLPEFTALENVAMPLLIQGVSVHKARLRAEKLLTKVGLEKRYQHKPGELSGGERQRAAVARAIITQPDCVLADEPTGNLDKKTAQPVFELMLELNREMGTSLVVVTHDESLAARLDKTYILDAGKLERLN